MTTLAADHRANLTGGLFMVGAMAAFAVEDAALKGAARSLPAGQILVLFGLGGAIIFALAARIGGHGLCPPEVLSRPMRVRVLFEIAGRLFYTLALTLIPLSTATVILQATPLVVVAGAALVFGERVGARRWVAIAIGLAGVVAIVRPGAETFSWMSLLAVAGMAGFAGRDLASRAAPRALSTAILGLYGFLAVVAAGLSWSLWEGAPWVLPPAGAVLGLSLAVPVGAGAYALLMRAMRTGDVSAVTPLRYTRLLFGIALGVLLFGETVDAVTLAGSVLVVVSGLVIVRRGRAAAPAR